MIIAGTGHRPNVLFKENFYSNENRIKLIDFALLQLEKLQEQYTIKKIIAGGAQGWDQCLAEAAIILNIPLLSAIPFEGMDGKWPQNSKDDLKRIINKSSEVIYTCEPGYANWKFYKRDKYMVDNADLVLALYNGNPTGGTAITVRYALEVNKPLHNCWDEWVK